LAEFNSVVEGVQRADVPKSDPMATFQDDRRRDKIALISALERLFENAEFPSHRANEGVHLKRDALGKPFVVWSGEVEEWARAKGYFSEYLHVSNTHDGEAHLLLAVYDTRVAGVGIDVVHLPRFAGKSRSMLRRFSSRIMSGVEFEAIESYLEEEGESELRLRVATHFSLMESASKACGTGLKVGLGMGRPTSLPLQSVGALAIDPAVRLHFEGDGRARLAELGAVESVGDWCVQGEYLVSAVVLLRA
jgi:phosphopantetheinyl transferase (holo-ACP synthase)